MNSKLVFYKAISPMHMGAGNKIGTVDMPIQREGHTNFPKMEASGIKGVLRAAYEREYNDTNEIFGSDDSENASMGKVNIFDAKILFFPVKSAEGIYGWITCPFVLDRFINDCSELTKCGEIINKKIPDIYSIRKSSSLIINQKSVILEEMRYEIKITEKNELIDFILKYAEEIVSEKMKKDVFVVSNSDFKFFVEMCTEINTRIRIGNGGTVVKGGLFTEEYVPEETVFYSFYESEKKNNYAFNKFVMFVKENKIQQFGGNRTLGKGITEIHITEVEGEKNE